MGVFMYSRTYKALLFLGIMVAVSTSLFADIVYDPMTNCYYTIPASPKINPAEYISLFQACVQIEYNMMLNNKGIWQSKKVVLKQISRYLKGVGTFTALRLLADLEKDKVYYPDGTVMKNIFS
jgi:hypothetical protein